MSGKIDPREVLTYLNELGYTNISALQLKDFIKDLKKIIKYDSRYGGNPEAPQGDPSYFGEDEDECDNFKCSRPDCYTGDDSDKENQNSRVQPRTQERENVKSIHKDKHIAVHIYDKKNRRHIDHAHCVHMDHNQLGGQYDQRGVKNTGMSTTCGCSKPGSTESTVKSTIAACSSREHLNSRASKTSSKEKKSRVTFMRATISKPLFNKSDPVALYHYYQSVWKHTKIPGQDSRDDLRWAVRERMLSGPKIEVKSRCNIPRCGWAR